MEGSVEGFSSLVEGGGEGFSSEEEKNRKRERDEAARGAVVEEW